jgi:3-deoxy-D-manno-octulosonate 8-phosphate phosphatase (KDO 8-P phosphatase)
MERKSSLNKIAETFIKQGGVFRISPESLAEKFTQIRGVVLDWDGVFHSGYKGEGYSGLFSEADSMGLNMLRYGHWRRKSELLHVSIVSGENNPTAVKFAEREHLTVCTKISDKKGAIDHLCRMENLKPSQIVCVFDDINDLSMAQVCGLRVQVKRQGSPLFVQYTDDHSLCDYVTAHSARDNAVREICELFLGLSGSYEHVVKSRMDFDKEYQQYLQARNSNKVNCYTSKNGIITLVD